MERNIIACFVARHLPPPLHPAARSSLIETPRRSVPLGPVTASRLHDRTNGTHDRAFDDNHLHGL